MTAQQLRNSILQQAIQGRLVPQDPNDEPASVLLERIRKEKEQLVKEGKLKKKDLATTPIADDEKPFDIPSGWEWCRLGTLIYLLSGQDLTPDRYTSEEGGIPYITGASCFIKGKLLLNRWTTSPTSVSHYGDLLITCKGTVGTMAYNQIGDIHIARQIMAISSKYMYLPYIQYFLEYMVPNLEKQAHSIIPGISRDVLLNLPIPLPPLAEQRRIVAKIEELMPLVEKYGKAQTELDTLNQDLPRRLRQSVLQQAIQGKLVEQDPNDEPIEVILRNFDKKIEYSIDEETPSGWCKISMGQITDFINGLAFKPEDWEEQGLPIVRIQNLSNPYAPCHKTTKVFDGKFKICKGDLLFSWSATLDSFIWEGGDAYLNQHIFKLIPKFFVDKYFLYYLLKAIVNEYKEVTHGSTMKHITKGVFENKIVLLPPLAEQRRIVAKIEELFAEIDKLK